MRNLVALAAALVLGLSLATPASAADATQQVHQLDKRIASLLDEVRSPDVTEWASLHDRVESPDVTEWASLLEDVRSPDNTEWASLMDEVRSPDMTEWASHLDDVRSPPRTEWANQPERLSKAIAIAIVLRDEGWKAHNEGRADYAQQCFELAEQILTPK
jgi:hypothetical protein